MHTSDSDFDLQIIITSGLEHADRATLGLAMALAAASSDTRVVCFFTMGGAIWADKNHGGHSYVPRFESVDHYLEMLHELDVRLEGCTTCVENCCPDLFKEHGKMNMRDGFIFTGLGKATIRATQTPTMVF